MADNAVRLVDGKVLLNTSAVAIADPCCCGCCKAMESGLACGVDGYPWKGATVEIHISEGDPACDGYYVVGGGGWFLGTPVWYELPYDGIPVCDLAGTWHLCGSFSKVDKSIGGIFNEPDCSYYATSGSLPWTGCIDVPISDTEGLGNIGGYPRIFLRMYCGARWPFRDGVDFDPEYAYVGVWILGTRDVGSFENPVFLSLLYHITDSTAARAAINTLLGGGTITIHYGSYAPGTDCESYTVGCACEASGSYVRVALECPPTTCPDVPPPSCSSLEICIPYLNQQCSIYFGGFINRTHFNKWDLDTIFHSGYGDTEYLYENLNGGIMHMRLATYSDPLASSGFVSTTNPWWFYIPLGTEGDYSDPGILVLRKTYYGPTAGWKKEVYCTGVYMQVSCTLGKAYFERVAFIFQGFNGQVGGSYPYVWPTYAFTAWNGIDLTDRTGGDAAWCRSDTMTGLFVDAFPVTGFGFDTPYSLGESIRVRGQIGGFAMS